MRPTIAALLGTAALLLLALAAPAGAQEACPQPTPATDADPAGDDAGCADLQDVDEGATLGERLGEGYLPVSLVGLLAVCALCVGALALRWKP